MSSSTIPSVRGYAEIPVGQFRGKSLKSIHVYQLEEALNVDLEFEYRSMLEMIFRVGFRASMKILDNENGDYSVRERLKPIIRQSST